MQNLTPQQRQTMQRKAERERAAGYLNAQTATLESPEHEQGYNNALKFALDEWKKYDPAPEIARAIRCWVRDNFGESEARDPSYNIRALAQAIADTIKGGYNEKIYE